MQRNGGSLRVDMETLPPPSADGGRYLANVIVYLAFRNTQYNAVTFEDTIPLANLHRYKET